MQVRHDLPWLPAGSTARLVVSDTLPPESAVSTAFVLAFDSEALLMTYVRAAGRGWNPPGGHREPGESVVGTAAREAREEACAIVDDLRPFGFQHIRHVGPATGRYPHPDSYQVFFLARVARLEPFRGTEEVRDRDLFTPGRARGLRWIREHLPFYEHAVTQARER